VTTRLTVTYAGYEGESALLEGLVKRGLAGEQIAPDFYQECWHSSHTGRVLNGSLA
jgi:hypothetical protein